MLLADGELVSSASDLNDYLTCPQRVALARVALAGGLARPEDDPTAEVIARKGAQHERAALGRLEAQGRRVVRIDEGDGSVAALRAAVAATREAMEQGADVIFQASFLHDGWTGRADFLLRVETPSALGAWSYEIADAKLAVSEKPAFLVQLCTYARLVEAIQGKLPARVHAIFGDGRQVAYDPARYLAYVDAARERYAAAVADLAPITVPEKIGACERCVWSERCETRRRSADDLSLVAGMRRTQSARLRERGIATVATLATATETARPPRVGADTFVTLRRQANLQVVQRSTGEPRYELLEPRDGSGFAQLPKPAPGDVYFDMEGDPLYEPTGGLEYLFGAYVDGAQPAYWSSWGETREQERRAFEAFIDWLVVHRRAHPGAHVYHYAAYEKTALRRLAMQHATREDAVDALLREGVLVDLYSVVKGALAQSQESYSIKKLEAFYGFRRSADVRKGDDSIVAFEEYLLSRDLARKGAIIAYNEEDCVSTHRLHQWLLRLRDEAEAAFGPIAWRETHEAALEEEQNDDDALRAVLEAGTVDDDDPRRVLAYLVGYHRREAKPVWWALFDRCERAAEIDFIDEDGEAIGGLTLAPEYPPFRAPRERKSTYTYTFPPQQHKLSPGRLRDPYRGAEASAYEVVAIDERAHLVQVRRRDDDPHPRALVPDGALSTKEQREALCRLAEAVIDGSVEQRYPAAWDLLRRALPRITGIVAGGRVQPEPRAPGAAIDPSDVADLAARLDNSTLVVQGPPGSGKTYTGARVIARLLADGKRVGVTSTSHRAIHNLLYAIEDAVAERGQRFTGVKKCDEKREDSQFVSRRAQPCIENAPKTAGFGEYQLVAGTSWMIASEKLEPVDVLVIDEAGQVSLADALAMATNARALVLLGDPLQLAHVSQGTHPIGCGASVLEHLLGSEGTVPEERGVFLDRTFRMHPTICRFVSEMVYDGRLVSAASCAAQRIDAAAFSGAGLQYVPVVHEGNAQRSPEEADVVADVVAGLVGGTFSASDGTTRTLGLDDVLIVSPYNAQVALLRRTLEDRFGEGVRVGTVDKFQGQEAPVVIYSLAASSAEDAPRGIDFLLEENRFNVAVSRGRALAVLVCSPAILETACATLPQMRAVAAFCQFAREAGEAEAALA